MRLGPREPFDPAVDERLVARCLAGDARAWEALVRRYERLVYAVARGYRLSPEDVGDVFQEVFAALVRGMPRLRDPRTLCRWLSSTTERIALATALARRREQSRNAGDPESRLEPVALAGPAGVDLEELENRMRVRLALDELGGSCRALLAALYYREPAPGYREVSAELGIPIGSIGPTRARCLEKLQRLLGREEAADGRIRTAPAPTSPAEGDERRRRSASVPGETPVPVREDRPHVP